MTQTTKPTPSLSRKGLPTFKTNPFLQAALLNTNEGVKKRSLKSKDGSQMMVTSQDGSVSAPAGFWHTQEVDKTQFIKLYVNGVKAFADLSSAGTKVFELVYLEIQKAIGRDTILLNFSDIDQSITTTSRTIFQRGVRELCVKGFLAESLVSGRYFINPDYVFNGDRLALVKEYRLKRDASSDEAWRDQLEAKGFETGQMRLD